MDPYGYLIIRLRLHNPASNRGNVVQLARLECQQQDSEKILADWCEANYDVANCRNNVFAHFEMSYQLTIPPMR